MAFAETYTEETLAAFMAAELSDVATLLGWTSLTQLQHPVNRTLRAAGVASIADADAQTLEALGTVEAWLAACKALASRYNTEADGLRTDREALQKHALAMLAQAKAEAIAGGFIVSGAVSSYAANEVSW